jgi:EAL domain-containing protein (putative c-di-GMP-specific phosphodiesterase class I)
VELIIALAQKMKVRVIADGVETARHLERLQELGCQSGQGYFFSPPVEASSAEKLLSRQFAQPQASGAAAQ